MVSTTKGQKNVQTLQKSINQTEQLTQKAKLLLNRIKEHKEKSSIGNITSIIDMDKS